MLKFASWNVWDYPRGLSSDNSTGMAKEFLKYLKYPMFNKLLNLFMRT